MLHTFRHTLLQLFKHAPVVSLLLVMLVMTGCNILQAPTPTNTPTNTPTPTDTPTNTPTPTDTLTNTPTPTDTPTNTPTPTDTLTNTPTPTDTPTNTPTPTDTPTNTPTLVSTVNVGDTSTSEHWAIRVTDVQTAEAIGTFKPRSTRAHFVILTLEITYLGPEAKGRFSPASLMLVNVDTQSTGWSNFASLYKQEGGSQFIEFLAAPAMRIISKGETVTENFAFVFLRESQRCVLYFPETRGIFIDGIEGGTPPTVTPVRPTRAVRTLRPSAVPTTTASGSTAGK